MASALLKSRTSADTPSRVEDDHEVSERRRLGDEIDARNRALEQERRDLDFVLNPNSFASLERRPGLSEAQTIEAEDRRREIGRLLRLIRAEREAATEALVSARRRAVDARLAACRAHIVERVRIFYADLERVAAGSHRELVDEIRAMNDVLHAPGQEPAFAEQTFLWPSLLPDSLLAQRRRELVADGWLADE